MNDQQLIAVWKAQLDSFKRTAPLGTNNDNDLVRLGFRLAVGDYMAVRFLEPVNATLKTMKRLAKERKAFRLAIGFNKDGV